MTFALPASDVIEILRAVAITYVPGCPDAVEGVVNVRGQPLPVYDVRARFGLAPRAVHPDDHLVIVAAGTRGSAIVRVNRARELRTVDPELVGRAERSTDPMIRGLARCEDGLLVVCDLSAFLGDLDAEQTATAIANHERST
jgi:purine-binding chemotaxis protein CheW